MSQLFDLRFGDWRNVLGDLGDEVDALIAEPPPGPESPDAMPFLPIDYGCWTEEHVRVFVDYWSPRTRGWMACFANDELIRPYRLAYRQNGRYDFPPIPCVSSRPRPRRDGPGAGPIYLMVARPRRREFTGWGALPDWYQAEPGDRPGERPLDLMRAIVRGYSRPGDVVCDPFAGLGTILIAAVADGRRALGAEVNEARYTEALRRLEGRAVTDNHQQTLF